MLGLIFTLLSICGTIVLAIIVLTNNKKSVIHIALFLFSLSFAGAIGSNYLTSFFKDPNKVLVWIRITMLFASLLTPFFYIFIKNFPEHRLVIAKRNLIILILLTLVSVILAISPWMFTSVEIVNDNIVAKQGPAFFYFILVFMYYLIYSIVILIKKIRNSVGIQKSQLKYILFGLTISFFFILLFNVVIAVLFKNSSLIIFTNIAPLIFISTVAYAIIKHRLMDIRVIIKKGVVYFGSIITIIGANGVVIYFNSKYEIISPLWLVIVVMAAGLALFEPLKDFYLKISNKYFFTSLYNYQETIKKTSAEITSTINLNEVITSIFDTIIKTMGLERQAIIVVGEHNHKNKKEHTYNVKKKTGFSDDEINQIIAGEMLVGYLEKHKKGLVVDELHKDIQARKDQGKGTSNLERLETKFKGLKVAICLPLITKGEINGIVVLGNKVSKDAYTVEDLELLETMADQAAVALENARLYEEVQDLNKNLQKKVNEATKEITEKNENLEELLRMKSEFLTVASHQLRTPTSIVRGMLSMLNEPDANKMTKKEKEEFIAQAFAASNNLEHVVHDLLSATELEGGKMKFNIEPLDPIPIIEEVILERQFMADEKGIALKFKKPKKKIQPILVDKYKLHELIANLLDNAIKYTLNGVVEIGLNPTEGKLDIYVKDTGIGLTKDDKEIIFGRFERGERVLKIQPNGTGLGLYIVKEVIEDMGGTVKAESEGEDKGSTFTITLPALVV